VKNVMSRLDEIININNFQNIQEYLSEVTEMAIVTVDYNGKFATKHSRCSEFCKIIRACPSYRQICEKCDSRGGIEAARIQQPYIYLCHFNIVDLAIPIIANGYYYGAVMAGQVLIKDDNEKQEIEKIVNDNYTRVDFDKERELYDLYQKLPAMTLDRVKSIANMLFYIIKYIVEEAEIKVNLDEQIENLLSSSLLKVANEDIEKFSKGKVQKPNNQDNLNSNIIDLKHSSCLNRKEERNKRNEPLHRGNKILNPAFEYIQNKYAQTISLEDMASLCNISTSYFSKLFKKTTNESLSGYVNKMRVNKAKEILINTDLAITNISSDLGFEDCGYFIKVFKKNEGVTPSVYRYRNSLETV